MSTKAGMGKDAVSLKPDLSNWDPENDATWDKKLAWRTLWITTYTMILAFATWYLVSAIAPRLNDIGYSLTEQQLYWLVALPGLAGGLIRLLFMFLPPLLGTRTLVTLSALLLLIPLLGWTFVVRDPTIPFWFLMLLSFSAGVGGGSFSGLMASTSYFFPKRLSGTALGLQAGIGNFGIGIVQFLVPWVVGFGLLGTAALTPQSQTDGTLIWLHNGGLVMVPWVLLAAILAIVFLRRVPVKANFRQQLNIFGLKHTWIMSALYLMSFGAFSGLAAQTGLIIKNVYGGFEDAPNPLAWAWIGPLLGAGIRAACGPLCDKWGGAKFTFLGGIGMTLGTIVTLFFLSPSSVNEFWGFLTGMMIIFFFSGFANAGTFKQMPMIFTKVQAGGTIGWTAAIGSFGPFLVGMALSVMSPATFFIVCAVWCGFCTWLAWWYYARPGAEKPSLFAQRSDLPRYTKGFTMAKRTRGTTAARSRVDSGARTDGPLADSLVSLGRYLRPGEVSNDLRSVYLQGGRAGDSFYRDRWSHDKVVRSTHGVNCTGSCSWKVYVKDGIITWETQQTDYPSVGPDSPEYEPRGCPRGAAFSWYTYSPTRVRYPYIRGVLLQMYREAKQRLGDPVEAWAEITSDPEKANTYKRARGKGGLVRADWEEAAEIIAAAHVHTIKKYGPDRVAGFSPIPAMSMVSHGVGARFVNLLGGTMQSFYDWYADLPVASPQVFGDQTDVPESADWFNSSYLMMWGSNVPVTRTPDAHFMTEARYRGQKVITVSPDYADNSKFADEWLAPHPGTDGALAMAMGHVILKEFLVDRRTAPFVDYLKRFADAPYLVALQQRGDAWVPGKFVTAADLGGADAETANPAFKTVLLDQNGAPVVPNGSLGHRFSKEDEGAWNLDLGDVDPLLSVMDSPTWSGEAAAIDLPRFDVTPDLEDGGEAHTGGTGIVRRGVPTATVAGKTVTTVFDLLLAQYGVGRDDLPGEWPTGYDDPSTPGTPAWQEEITSVPAEKAERIGREFADNAERSGGRSMIIMGAGTNHWFHSDTIYRTFLTLTTITGCQGVNGGGWAHYVGQEKVRPLTGYNQYQLAADWVRPARNMIGTAFWYLATDQWRYDGLPADQLASPLASGQFADRTTADCMVESAKRGWMPSYPTFDRNPLDIVDEAREKGVEPQQYVVDSLKDGSLRFACEDPDSPENFPRVLSIWRGNILGSSGKGNEYFLKHLLGTDAAVRAPEAEGDRRPRDMRWHDEAPEGKLDLLFTADFRMTSTTLFSDVVLPAATWYEKYDLSSTDMHPFVHSFNPAIKPPWQTRTDFEIFHVLAKKISVMARTHLGVREDLVAAPLMHDTADAMATPNGTVDGDAPLVPGVTMPKLLVVERDYTKLADQMATLGPLTEKLGMQTKGITYEPKPELEKLGRVNGLVQSGPYAGSIRLDTDVRACEMILTLSGTTNGRLSLQGFEKLGKHTGQTSLTELASGSEDTRVTFPDVQSRPVPVITSPEWSGSEHGGRRYTAFAVNVEHKKPWHTLTGRMHFYLDHDWMLELGESMPIYRPPLDLHRLYGDEKVGSTTPTGAPGSAGRAEVAVRYLTPHSKWSIHSEYQDNLFMLSLSRGGPTIWMSPQDADKIGVRDNEWIEAYNRNGVVVARANVSHRMPEGTVFMYHAKDRTVDVPKAETSGLRGGIHNSLTRVLMKPSHLIGGYAQLSFAFNYLGPTGNQRDEVTVIRRRSQEVEY